MQYLHLVFFLELGHVHSDETLQSHSGLTSMKATSPRTGDSKTQ